VKPMFIATFRTAAVFGFAKAGSIRGKHIGGWVLMQFDVARASCACIHGRDARATFSNCTSTGGCLAEQATNLAAD